MTASKCLIWSAEHSMWWSGDEHGYTAELSQAGLYDWTAGQEICQRAALIWDGEGFPPEVAVSYDGEFVNVLLNDSEVNEIFQKKVENAIFSIQWAWKVGRTFQKYYPSKE